MMVLGAWLGLLVKRRQDGSVLATCEFNNYHVFNNIWLAISLLIPRMSRYFLAIFFRRFSVVNL